MSEASGTTSVGGSSKEKVQLHVKELGLTQIDGHTKDHDFIADVIFVHGLQGHPKRTWQSKSSTETHKGLRKRLQGLSISASKKRVHEDNRLFWPAELLPNDFKTTRIMTYGYDSKVTKAFKGPTSKNGIFQHGRSFLGALSRVRVDCANRPIIVVAHSLGGLIVKQALIEARKQTTFHDVYYNTYAIVFFGTPHRGSNVASWGRLLSGIAQAAQVDTNDGILIDLDPESGSSKLEELRLDFDDILRDSQRARKLRVFSFQEEQGMTGIHILGSKVVPNESSSLDSREYGNDTIHANHMGICRFEDENDDGYEKFKGVLADFIAESKREQGNATATRKADLLRSLDYAEKHSREHQLRNIEATEESLSWIWSSSTSFVNWLSSSNGLFWIAGKPGTGKSTLIDHLVHKNRLSSKLRHCSPLDWIVLRFFFDFRGGKGLTNSFEGLLRSLLYQLIQEMPQVDILGLDKCENDPFSGWPEHRLRNALRGSLESAKHGICILVDGLDEYEGNVLDLIQFLKGLAQSNESQEAPIKICLSSRPEPVPSQLLQHLPHLFVSDYNASGIRSYCSQTLEGLEAVIREDLDISQLSKLVAERAEGVFLWARFALGELIHGHFSGETFDEMLVRLESIPQDLEDCYDRILGRIQKLAKEECMIMLQLVCFAKRQLLWREHLVATRIATGKDLVLGESIFRDEDSANPPLLYSTYAKRIRAKAVGLLELVEDRSPEGVDKCRVKLIHRSVSTYLDRKGWQILAESESESESYNPARHEAWYVEVCTRYLQCLLHRLELGSSTGQNVWMDWLHGNEQSLYARLGAKKYQSVTSHPFFDYAGRYIFEHAESLESHGTSSYPLLHDSLTEQIVSLHMFCAKSISFVTCTVCYNVPKNVIFEGYDPIYVAFLHGLRAYRKSDLAIRVPAPGQDFWDRALRCAVYSRCSSSIDDDSIQETVSLALRNLISVQQHHMEDMFNLRSFFFWDSCFRVSKLVLLHESVIDLPLTDSEGHEVKLLWFYPHDFELYGESNKAQLSVLIEAAKRRGEDVRQSCGPEGNVVEMLLKQRPGFTRRMKLTALREHYESMSWPFEYDADEIEREISDEELEEEEYSYSKYNNSDSGNRTHRKMRTQRRSGTVFQQLGTLFQEALSNTSTAETRTPNTSFTDEAARINQRAKTLPNIYTISKGGASSSGTQYDA